MLQQESQQKAQLSLSLRPKCCTAELAVAAGGPLRGIVTLADIKLGKITENMAKHGAHGNHQEVNMAPQSSKRETKKQRRRSKRKEAVVANKAPISRQTTEAKTQAEKDQEHEKNNTLLLLVLRRWWCAASLQQSSYVCNGKC